MIVLELAAAFATSTAMMVLLYVIHEAGHVTAARCLGIRLTGFAKGWGLGVHLGSDDIQLTRRQRAIVAAWGPGGSMVLALTAARNGMPIIATFSALLAVVSLIPIGPSDGRNVLREMRR